LSVVQSVYPSVSIFPLHYVLPSHFYSVGHVLDSFKRNYLGFRVGSDMINYCFKIIFHLGQSLSSPFLFFYRQEFSAVLCSILSMLICTSVTSCVLILKDLFSVVKRNTDFGV
jgi:hypothetical protein